MNGYFPNHTFNLFMGNGTTMTAMYDFNSDNFDHSNLDFIGGGQIFCCTGERDPVTSATAVPIGSDKHWGQERKSALREQWNHYCDIGWEAESLPYTDQFLDLDPKYTAADGQPLLRLTIDWHRNDYNMYRFVIARMKEIMQKMGPAKMSATEELDPYNIHAYQSTHPTGGAIMGIDPGNSVTNKYGQVWDTPNVFVTGAALFPQNAGANPTDTVAAITYMAGDAIREKYCQDPNRIVSS